MKSLFLDTNIVLDLLEERKPFCDDALQYFSALVVNVEVIITRNGKDFMSSTLPVMTAGEWLDGLN